MDEQSNSGRMSELETQLVNQALQDSAFRDRLLNDPKSVLAERGLVVPDEVQVQVLQETPSQYYLVLPAIETAAVTQLSEQELEAVSGGLFSGNSTQVTTWTGCASTAC